LRLPPFSLLLVGFLLGACAQPSQPLSAPRRPGGGDPLRVVTTVLPITLFTRAVAAGCAQVEPLLPAGAGAHDVQATPSQLARLRQADVLVINGLGLETFLDRLITGAAAPSLRVIDASRGIATLVTPTDGDHGHGEEHGTAHGHGPLNPHVWLDPQRAARQVATIRDGLIAADPGCQARYSANAAAFLAELRRLDGDLARQLAPYAGRRFVAFHDTAPYFAERYRLQAEFLVDVPEQNPSPADLQRVTRLVRQSHLQALLAEPQAAGRSLQALARDLGVRVSQFDPIETAPGEASLRPDHYLETMRRNGRDLVAAFGPPRPLKAAGADGR
jgi:zinc transport system substrate-binding protein